MQRSFPSPFRARTSVQFTLPAAGHGEIAVIDLLGRRVSVLAEGEFEAGPHTVTWDGRDERGRPVGAGTYLVLVKHAGATVTGKVTLIR